MSGIRTFAPDISPDLSPPGQFPLLYRVRKKGPTIFWPWLWQIYRQLFIIFGKNHSDNMRDWKIVNCHIIVCTTLYVVMTSLWRHWKCRFRKKRNAIIYSASTAASKFARFKSSWLKCVGNTARQGVQNTHDLSRRPQAPHKNSVS